MCMHQSTIHDKLTPEWGRLGRAKKSWQQANTTSLIHALGILSALGRRALEDVQGCP